ncbi:MAG: hypothetical protein J2P49_07655, partial [Methylocapsa sp.]|nr:hypothetical protein [Methylocapsa sp.]
YLWHWPIVACLTYADIEIGPLLSIIVAAVSSLLAWLSWKFVEVPMRRSGTSLECSQVFVRRFGIPSLALFAIAIAAACAAGFPDRFDPQVAELDRVLEAKPDVLRWGCQVPSALYDTPPSASCRIGAGNPALDGILIGDSFANHFTGVIEVLAKAQGISLMDYSTDGCPPILGYYTGKTGRYVAYCLRRNEAAYALIASNHYRRVVLAANWPREPAAKEQLIASIEAVLKSGAELTVILSSESIARAASCPIRRRVFGATRSWEGAQRGAPEYFGEIQSRFPQVRFIDPNQVICEDKKCRPILMDVPLYRDDNHLNDAGSRLIGHALLSRGVAL